MPTSGPLAATREGAAERQRRALAIGAEGGGGLEEPLLTSGGEGDGADGDGDAGDAAVDSLAVRKLIAGTAFDLERHRLKKKGLVAQHAAGGEDVLRIGGKYEDPAFDWVVRAKTRQIFFASMAGVVTMVGMALYTWYVNTRVDPTAPTDAYYDGPRVSPTTLNVMYLGQAVLTLSTVVTMVLIAQKYSLRLMEKRAEWSGVTIRELERHRGEAALDANRQAFFIRSYPLLTSSLFLRCLLELLIHLLHPVVWMASYSSLSGGQSIDRTPNTGYKLMQICVLFRFYLVAELIHVYSSVYIHRFEIITAKPELLKIGFAITRFFTVKLQFFKRPVSMLIAISICSLFIFGFVLFMSERVEGYVPTAPSSLPFEPLNALWSAFETFTTLGYGGLIPTTTIGRITSCLCAVTGIVTFIIFSAVLVQQMALTREQKYALEYLNCRSADIKYRAASESLVWTWIEVHLLPEVRREVSKRLGALAMDEADDSRNRRSHKGNRIYHVTKRFRHARRDLEGAFAQANDEVIDQKLSAVKELVEALGEEMADHQRALAAVEQEAQARLKALVSKMAELRRRGHVPV